MSGRYFSSFDFLLKNCDTIFIESTFSKPQIHVEIYSYVPTVDLVSTCKCIMLRIFKDCTVMIFSHFNSNLIQ